MGSIQVSQHIWVITGENRSKFPSGTAVFIHTENYRVLIDTNPGRNGIETFLRRSRKLELGDLTDILLTHAHLDHVKALGQLFKISKANIWGLPDTLARCEDSRWIGMYAGIPPAEIHHFVNFGKEQGFIPRSYPGSSKQPIIPGKVLEFDGVSILPHLSHAHALNVLDLEINDQGNRVIFSQDYDFTPVPWYGVPQRGLSIPNFINEARKIITAHPDYIISSHRETPLKPATYAQELVNYEDVIAARTERVIEYVAKLGAKKLRDLPEFIYPISKMRGKYSEDYIRLGQIWDRWILLAHLEDAWGKNRAECIDAGGDRFLTKCIEDGGYKPEYVSKYLVSGWCEMTLEGKAPFTIPLDSRWKLLS